MVVLSCSGVLGWAEASELGWVMLGNSAVLALAGMGASSLGLAVLGWGCSAVLGWAGLGFGCAVLALLCRAGCDVLCFALLG